MPDTCHDHRHLSDAGALHIELLCAIYFNFRRALRALDTYYHDDSVIEKWRPRLSAALKGLNARQARNKRARRGRLCAGREELKMIGNADTAGDPLRV